MPIYDRPTKSLMHDFADQELKPGQVFDKSAAVDWFTKYYPKIKSNTVQMHVEAMSVNSTSRKHHPSIRRGSGHDLFFKVGPSRFRRWNSESDPAPFYPGEIVTQDDASDSDDREMLDDGFFSESYRDNAAREFALEKDLQNYLVKNIHLLESGLHVYEDEGIRGVEYQAGGRFIDILAIDTNKNFVVIELKVSRGHDRVVGQILRYMAWVQKNMANGNSVRGIIVASEMSEDIVLAASLAPNVRLVEYEISFKLKPIAE